VTATIVVTSWSIAILFFAFVANTMGFTDTARDSMRVARAFLAGGGALLAVALLFGLMPWRPASTVEGAAQR
jgi:hypothetical protein